ncbi:MAG: sn-glycerol-3-phosphate ABC transporter ATP-binding protein UgpC [Cellvibrio sp.]|uniref:ABC transporter ATP-binding protein n=1 Tax=Cellvibrio sp. TaxID=1965322 RepID=UPI0031A1B36A
MSISNIISSFSLFSRPDAVVESASYENEAVSTPNTGASKSAALKTALNTNGERFPLSLRELGKRYDSERQTLAGVDLEVNAGEFVVLVGPSGCGKSTLLRMVAGLESVSEGEILIGDQAVNDLPPSERDIAMVFQDYALYPHKTVFENIAFGLRVRGAAKDEIERRVNEVAAQLQITEFLSRKPAALSGGQRQRVAIGRALARHARLFLFDEPLSNLDVKLRNEMRVEIKKLHQQFGITTLYVTHDQIEAMTLADRIAVMANGKVEQYGTPDEIYNEPATTFVASFIGSPEMNLLTLPLREQAGARGVLLGDLFLLLPAEFSAYQGDEIVVGLRPEAILRAQDQTETITACILLIEPLGAETIVTLTVHGQQVTGRWAADRNLATATTLPIAVDNQRLHWFDPQTRVNLALQFSNDATSAEAQA